MRTEASISSNQNGAQMSAW